MCLLDDTFTSTQVDWLLYVALGDDCYEDVPVANTELLPRPDYITAQLLTRLYFLPVSITLLERVRQSMFDQPKAWEKLLQDSNLPSPNSLPWSSAEREETITLEDLVLLKAISPNVVSTYIESSVTELMQSLPVPLLTDALLSGGDLPLLLLHDETSLISQANMIMFQDALNGLINVSVCVCVDSVLIVMFLLIGSD